MLDKIEIARALREIGQLLELKGENAFKVKAYYNGAETLENMVEDLGEYVDTQKLTSLRSIGAALAAKISEMHQTGRCDMLERLRAEMPAGVLELSQIPGLSTKKIQALQSALNITSIVELRAACNAGLVATVTGFGKKTEEKILAGIDAYETRVDRILLVDAQEIAERLTDYLRTFGAERAEAAGSLRRWQESVGNINIVVASKEPAKLLQAFASFPAVTSVESRSETDMSVRLATGVRATIHLCHPNNWWTALFLQTGSKAHLDRLQSIAQKLNVELKDDCVFVDGKQAAINSEQQIYELLNLPFLVAELREDEGEIELAQGGETFEDLISIEDLQGMVHCHSTFSDGRNSIEAMACEAEKLGMKYITLTDHSPAAHYAGGLSVADLRKQWKEIEHVQKNLKIKILRGTESDILEDGSLDYPADTLEQLDIVIASIHSRMKMDEDQMTTRLINCMRQKQFKIWGHALGRLVLRREPIKCRVEEILDVVSHSSAAIEVNGDPYRLDMEPRWLRAAKKRDIKFVISVDAHSTHDLHNLRFGVHMARRAGLRKSDVLNALPLAEFAEVVRPVRQVSKI